ncbi:hypothetical protein [Prauserella flavalba]|uniref:Uncharacterized protein n=1 Tax=Prauserella flavalba TaxID=1477506 RepID=A0A318LIB9_9PSEU|nr:hypothetical protein [Prauserella flavalba]PXY29669.1 hypothetical protein BA062_21035 [Prauserella flavalba]
MRGRTLLPLLATTFAVLAPPPPSARLASPLTLSADMSTVYGDDIGARYTGGAFTGTGYLLPPEQPLGENVNRVTTALGAGDRRDRRRDRRPGLAGAGGRRGPRREPCCRNPHRTRPLRLRRYLDTGAAEPGVPECRAT